VQVVPVLLLLVLLLLLLLLVLAVGGVRLPVGGARVVGEEILLARI
jgi:hypothetical protein